MDDEQKKNEFYYESRKQRKITKDEEEFTEDACKISSDSSDHMDDFEPEVLSDPDNEKKKDKRKVGRRHRTDVDMADLHEDEQTGGDIIFIDNLPNSYAEIRALLE